jgi:hypothetical protein
LLGSSGTLQHGLKIVVVNNGEYARKLVRADSGAASAIAFLLAHSEEGVKLLLENDSALATELVEADQKCLNYVALYWAKNPANQAKLFADNYKMAKAFLKKKGSALIVENIAKIAALSDEGLKFLTENGFRVAKIIIRKDRYATDDVAAAICKTTIGLEAVRSGEFLNWFNSRSVSKANRMEGLARFLAGISSSDEGLEPV